MLCGECILVGQGRSTHQAIICIKSEVHAAVEVFPEWMRLVGSRGVGLDVRRKADLESDAPIVHVLSQLSILNEPRGMSEPVGSALVNSVANRARAVAFSRMNCNGEVVLPCVRERVSVSRCGKSLFSSSQIERHHSLV